VRLEPVIMELERQENILIIGHQVKSDYCLWVTVMTDPFFFRAGHLALLVSLLGMLTVEYVDWIGLKDTPTSMTFPRSTCHTLKSHYIL